MGKRRMVIPTEAEKKLDLSWGGWTGMQDYLAKWAKELAEREAKVSEQELRHEFAFVLLGQGVGTDDLSRHLDTVVGAIRDIRQSSGASVVEDSGASGTEGVN